MLLFPISAVAQRTGLPLDTLRAWERRYAAVLPARGTRGRVYTEEQIGRLQLLRQLVDQGHAIGQVAKLEDQQLRKLLGHEPTAGASGSLEKPGPPAKQGSAGMDALPQTEEILAPVFKALDRYDYAATDRELGRLAAAVGQPRDFVYSIALPLVGKIGKDWHEGKRSIAQEHMLTSLLSTVLSSMVRTCTPTDPPAKVLLATPQGDLHAFPILVAAMLTAAAGLGVVYLGTDLPAAEIVQAARLSGADAVLLSVSTTPSPETVSDLAFVSRKLHRRTHLWLGGGSHLGLHEVLDSNRWNVLNQFSSLESNLNMLRKEATR